MDDIQDALAEITGARSVPRVFVGGAFIGGGDDTVRGLLSLSVLISALVLPCSTTPSFIQYTRHYHKKGLLRKCAVKPHSSCMHAPTLSCARTHSHTHSHTATHTVTHTVTQPHTQSYTHTHVFAQAKKAANGELKQLLAAQGLA